VKMNQIKYLQFVGNRGSLMSYHNNAQVPALNATCTM